MIHRTRGIVIHHTKFSESSVVAKIYTEYAGMQSFIVNSVRSRKSKTKGAAFQPLTLVDLVIHHREARGLQRISEVSIHPPFHSIPFDITKSSQAFFISEVLYKALKEGEADAELFEFLYSSVLMLDLETSHRPAFHIYFLISLSRHLGFSPMGKYSENTPLFDLREGKFIREEPHYPEFIEGEESELFSKLLHSANKEELQIPYSMKKNLLQHLLDYFKLHVAGFTEIKSAEVLSAVLSGNS